MALRAAPSHEPRSPSQFDHAGIATGSRGPNGIDLLVAVRVQPPPPPRRSPSSTSESRDEDGGATSAAAATPEGPATPPRSGLSERFGGRAVARDHQPRSASQFAHAGVAAGVVENGIDMMAVVRATPPPVPKRSPVSIEIPP